MTPVDGLVVAIGIGNILLGDDGVGVRVIEDLRSQRARDPRSLPDDIRLVDGGTMGVGLVDIVRAARGVVLVDAVRLGGPSGSVRLFREGALADLVRPDRDGDGAGPAIGDLLAMARLTGWRPGALTLVGVEVHLIEPGLRLSPPVDAALPLAAEAVCQELWRMGRMAEVMA